MQIHLEKTKEDELEEIEREVSRVSKLLKKYDPTAHEEYLKVMSQIDHFKEKWNLPSTLS